MTSPKIFQRRLVPIIDRRLSEFSEDENLHRIDLLEVDMGTIDAQHSNQVN